MSVNKEYLLDGKPVREHLLCMSERANKTFAEKLNPGVENVLGLRLPDMRKLAIQIAKIEWQLYLSTAPVFYMEERMLQGLVLGYVKMDEDIETYLSYVTRFVKIINSWSVCDSFKFAGGKKFLSLHSDRIWDYLKSFVVSDKEYEIRFGVVMMMKYFIDDTHIDELLSIYDHVHHDGYYVKMAVAWAISFCFISYPEKTMEYLKKSSLDDFTFNKSIQKTIESYRVDDDMKTVLRSMRRK